MKSHFNRLAFLLTVVVAVLGAFAQSVLAQSYPSRPVRVIVPFPAGSGGDVVARLYSPKLAEATGQQFIVDNRAGAAGNIGAEAVVRSPADGYTLLLAPASLASSQSMVKTPPFDLVRDFDPIAVLASLPFLLVINPALPVQSVKELIELARSRPGQLNYASSGVGGAGHLSAELFRSLAGINIVHVPYKGGVDGIPDMIQGQISMMITVITVVMPHIRAGRLRALAMTSTRRSPLAPDLPTIAESGFPGYEAGTWHALLAPAGVSPQIVSRLNGLIIKIGGSPEMRERLLAQGAEAQADTPEQVRAFIRSEVIKWGKVIAASGARAE